MQICRGEQSLCFIKLLLVRNRRDTAQQAHGGTVPQAAPGQGTPAAAIAARSTPAQASYAAGDHQSEYTRTGPPTSFSGGPPPVLLNKPEPTVPWVKMYS